MRWLDCLTDWIDRRADWLEDRAQDIRVRGELNREIAAIKAENEVRIFREAARRIAARRHFGDTAKAKITENTNAF
jgi:hypothetical protein